MRLDWLLSPPCCLCERPAIAAGLCRDCTRQCLNLHRWQRLSHPSTPPIPVLAWAPYSEVLRQALHRLKYEKQRRLGETLGLWLARDLPWHQRLSLLPIPLHAERLAQRGYNQAEEISRSICRQRGDRHYPQLLQRQRATTAQFSLSRRDREINLQNAFSVPPQSPAVPAPLILVDDIYTSGATISAAQTALSRAGYRVQGVLVVAVAQSEKFTD